MMEEAFLDTNVLVRHFVYDRFSPPPPRNAWRPSRQASFVSRPPCSWSSGPGSLLRLAHAIAALRERRSLPGYPPPEPRGAVDPARPGRSGS